MPHQQPRQTGQKAVMESPRSSREEQLRKEERRDNILIAVAFGIPIALILIVGTWFLGMWPDWAYYQSRCPEWVEPEQYPQRGIIIYTDENGCRTWRYSD